MLQTHVSVLAAMLVICTYDDFAYDADLAKGADFAYGADFTYGAVQAETDVDSLWEQVSLSESRNRSPSRRQAGLTDEEMGMHLSACFIRTFLPWLICRAEV